MGNLKSKLIISFLILSLSSCNKFELKGFVSSYEQANFRFDQSMNWNDANGYTEINLPANTYAIHSMGDSHIGPTENLDLFFENSKVENAAAVVLVGDITTGNVEDYQVLVNHLPSKESLMYFALTGNHDLYFDGWKQFRELFGTSSYYFVVNTPAASDIFIGLETGGGTLGDKQLEWLKNLLNSKRANYRYCTVFTHNNLFRLRPTESTNPFAEEIQVLADLFARYKVNMVVNGHDHKRNTAVFGYTTYLIMDALLDSNKNASYLKITYSQQNMEYRFVEI